MSSSRFPSASIRGFRAGRIVLIMTLIFMLVMPSLSVPVVMASSFSPSVLVNTEAFMTVDDSDTASNVVIKFGDTLAKTITYNRTASRFDFNAPVSVKGNLSGATLNVNSLRNCDTIDTDSAGLMTCGTDATGAGGGGMWSGTGSLATYFDRGYVNTVGDTMTGTLMLSNNAKVNASGAILTNTGIILNSDRGATDTALTFGNATLGQTLKYLNASQRFQFSTGVSVAGNLSGATLNVNSLRNCDTIDTDSAGLMTCGTDATGAGGGLSQADGDARYLRQSGGSMTGNLVIKNSARLNASGAILTNTGIILNSRHLAADAIISFGNSIADQTLQFIHSKQLFNFSTNINVIGTASGRVVHAQDRLESSGTLLVTGNGKFDGGTLYIDSTNNKVGVNTVSPETALEVVGSMSGRLIRAQNRLESSGSLVVAGTTTLKPSATQAISAAGNSILANASLVVLDPNANYTMTSTPAIADGSLGQIVVLSAANSEANTVTLLDQDILASSNMQLGSSSGRVISAKKALTLLFDGTDWVETGYTTESADLQTFTTLGANTWTKPAGAKLVTVRICGGGGSGGGGHGAAAGGIRSGGGGGGGGSCAERTMLASNLAATVTVTIGAGGASVAGGTNAAGTDGLVGTSSTFGVFLTGYGGGGGAGNTVGSGGGGGGGCSGVGQSITTTTGGTGGACMIAGTANTSTATAVGAGGGTAGAGVVTGPGSLYGGGGGGTASTGGAAAGGAGGVSLWSAGGGGGGGGMTALNVAVGGGAGGGTGGDQTATSGGGGTAGSTAACASGGNGGIGADATSTDMAKGGGGGGAQTAATGCTGGIGGIGGGGGGAGGAGTNIGGASGAGGRGQAWVWTSF